MYLEYEKPKKKSKTQKYLFLLKKFEEETKPTFSICDLAPQDELGQLIFREDKNFFGALSYEDKIILSDKLRAERISREQDGLCDLSGHSADVRGRNITLC